MKDVPRAVVDAAPRHAGYWHGLKLRDYLGGPFNDRTGGLITFSLADDASVDELVSHDPFVAEGLLDMSLVKEWTTTGPVRPAP